MVRWVSLALGLALWAAIWASTGAPAGRRPLGDCASEPGLAGRGDIVFCEPWESPDWWRQGYLRAGRLVRPLAAREEELEYAHVETAGCVSGKCLRIDMKQFETTGLNLYWPLKNAGLEPQQLYLRYYLKLGPTWDSDNCREVNGKAVLEDAGGKFPGLADIRNDGDQAGQCGYGGEPGDGIDCWSHRAYFRDCYSGSTGNKICETVPGAVTRYGGYVYFPGQEGFTGNPAIWDSDPWGQAFGKGGSCATDPTDLYCPVGRNAGVLVRGRWYALEQFIKMNTPGKADGIIRGWVDGHLAYQKTNMVFRLPGHHNLHVRQLWLDVYKGGLYGGCRDGSLWLDQLVLARDAPIGPIRAAVSR
jgi:hypothetical protein